MQQVMIYDYLGREGDPVFKKISGLQKGETILVEEVDLSLNKFGLYEISNESLHECFEDVMTCYEFICNLSREKLLGETVQETW